MKLTAKQQLQIHDRMKRTGETYDTARAAVLGWVRLSPVDREAIYAARRAELRAQDDANLAAAMALLASVPRRTR